MTAAVFSIADRQTREVQSRALAAVSLQRQRLQGGERPKLAEILRVDLLKPGVVAYASLDEWYRAQPTPAGRIAPRLSLSADEKRIYGLPVSAQLMPLGDLGGRLRNWSVVVAPVLGGFVVGVKAPADGGGVGVIWKRSYKASNYALRLAAEHGLPIVERYA